MTDPIHLFTKPPQAHLLEQLENSGKVKKGLFRSRTCVCVRTCKGKLQVSIEKLNFLQLFFRRLGFYSHTRLQIIAKRLFPNIAGNQFTSYDKVSQVALKHLLQKATKQKCTFLLHAEPPRIQYKIPGRAPVNRFSLSYQCLEVLNHHFLKKEMRFRVKALMASLSARIAASLNLSLEPKVEVHEETVSLAEYLSLFQSLPKKNEAKMRTDLQALKLNPNEIETALKPFKGADSGSKEPSQLESIVNDALYLSSARGEKSFKIQRMFLFQKHQHTSGTIDTLNAIQKDLDQLEALIRHPTIENYLLNVSKNPHDDLLAIARFARKEGKQRFPELAKHLETFAPAPKLQEPLGTVVGACP